MQSPSKQIRKGMGSKGMGYTFGHFASNRTEALRLHEELLKYIHPQRRECQGFRQELGKAKDEGLYKYFETFPAVSILANYGYLLT
jgi:hypothetical protein